MERRDLLKATGVVGLTGLAGFGGYASTPVGSSRDLSPQDELVRKDHWDWAPASTPPSTPDQSSESPPSTETSTEPAPSTETPTAEDCEDFER